MPHSVPDLLRLFDSLPPSNADPGRIRFVARAVPGMAACTVGKDAGGLPVVIVETESSVARGPASPLVLDKVSVLHDVNCRLQLPAAGVDIKRASIIRCTDPDRLLHEYFLRAVTPVLMTLPPEPTRQQVAAGVDTLVMLFSQTVQAPRKTVMGLWAELFVIARSQNPATLIRCWHALPEDRFDFACDSDRLEVKAAAGRIRFHRFALEQLRPPQGIRAVIASMLMERTGNGETIATLVNKIRQVVDDPELLIRLDMLIAQTLGTDWRRAGDVSYDREVAEDSLLFMDVRDVPSVTGTLPPEISEVHFRVDLARQQSANSFQVARFGDLIRSATPSHPV